MRFEPKLSRLTAGVALAMACGAAAAQAGQTVKVAFIDPLSGPFANVGQNQLKSFQFIAAELSKKNAAGVEQEERGRREVRDAALRQQGLAAGESFDHCCTHRLAYLREYFLQK